MAKNGKVEDSREKELGREVSALQKELNQARNQMERTERESERKVSALQRLIDEGKDEADRREKELGRKVVSLERQVEDTVRRSKPAPTWVSALAPVAAWGGGADIVWVIGTAGVTTVFNRAQRATGKDIIWAIAEAFVGGVVAMSVATASQAHTVRNVSLGISTAGVMTLVNRILE